MVQTDFHTKINLTGDAKNLVLVLGGLWRVRCKE